ncbi:MAG: insulinase family protein [Lachnospiraceae bacterium]|nr:insulinase family protein [Lachnospiraceae bacterium]
MSITDLTTYEVIEKRRIEDINSMGYLLKHKKSGARVVVCENDDYNKVFYIGFRTPPKDSTGVAHILEHSVLCGSKQFPAKDPFVELAKGSLNTFLNAMTYPDKTVYPLASCNDQDFKNLMHVYMDAVLYPNIYKEEKIFRQEGWHYEMENIDAPLTINGVVYNEMKGAFSSPDDVLDREIFNSLYPDTAYGVESGGAPEDIPNLTYEEFLNFHKQYYHPSNSYIYLYGDADMEERLRWLDESYLSAYDTISVDSFPGKQKPFEDRAMLKKEFPISEEESEEDNTYFSYNTMVGDVLDRELYQAFQVIDYAIAGAPGTPVKQALIDAGIGTDVYSVYENGIYQPYYSIIAKNANAEDETKFISIIEEQLAKIVKNGFDRNALLAGLNSLEFRHREADYGTNPKGLMYGLGILDSWLYEDREPFLHIEANGTFAALREKIDTGYFEALVEKYLINNPHKTILTVVPKKGLTAKKDAELAKKLAAYKDSLSEKEKEDIIEGAKALKQYQGTPDTKEVLRCIPRLTRDDITKKAEPLTNELITIDGVKTLYHNIVTNGIAYIGLLFDLKKIPAGLYPYIGLLKAVLGYVDTASYSYEQLGYEINKQTGNLYSVVHQMAKNGDIEEIAAYYEVKISVMYSNINAGLKLVEEILFSSAIDDEKRLKEIISETKSRMQARFMSAGHAVAAGRALSYASAYGAMSDDISGLGFYQFIEKAEAEFEQKKEEIIRNLKTAMRYIFRKENLLIDLIGTDEAKELLNGKISPLLQKLSQEPLSEMQDTPVVQKKNEGLTTSAQVQYVCRAGNYRKHGLDYVGTLRLLKTILGYEYLWNEVRVKGGAYGCMSSYGRNGESYFVSYRDPNLEHTISIYEKAAEFVRGFEADEEVMTKYIIGTISELDIPLTPRTRGSRSMYAYLSNLSYEEIQKERDDILAASEADVRKLGDYIAAFMSDNNLCVVGNEEKIKEQKELFMNVAPLIH